MHCKLYKKSVTGCEKMEPVREGGKTAGGKEREKYKSQEAAMSYIHAYQNGIL